MQRKKITADSHWQERVEKIGFGYHTDENNLPYWIENYYYSISEKEADQIYDATNELWEMCLHAVEYVISNNRLDEFKIPKFIQPYLIDTWKNDAPSIYSRFDFAYHNGQLKLLEFNADTPTSLFECGVVQWLWMEYYFGTQKDQFNSVHEKLIETWKMLKPYLKGEVVHFTCVRESLEDLTNLEYIRDCAIQAGLQTKLIYIDEIGWNNIHFVDLEEEPITDIFKLYPWEWMVNELFAYNIKNDEFNANWIEPAWKMILSNKAILPILWELYPNHPLLLEAYFESANGMENYVKKPLLSREGANIEVIKEGKLFEKTSGEYGEEGFIYQAFANLHQEETAYAIIGSWIIGQEACGITFRESDQYITTDKSRFVPHIIE
ncbi:glutathionylspermidine synthase family protein [Weeksella virosa]|uniref:Glutathionylspermidine synthase n=1 Tax=Weeksella virosa (strain ATCC 43766 / DSM 16922 / JCM 21250 / CCUG 30538 / CDC 9751 / IAM 14551 / NBRC 16016 / NCTC 11634 / CL345/78) TaxID=865938 RepID=F0NZ84_WEEVC|nr:glutathionylspermidine synthase family protein [Weeksella virosa]ADX67213.1 Glutathionylspermidine synthase [Weeksella virosa DSM 16922]VEH63050.1 Bifunctional glutathionylspermidine synthetase/amidase [Weeksella virosa]